MSTTPPIGDFECELVNINKKEDAEGRVAAEWDFKIARGSFEGDSLSIAIGEPSFGFDDFFFDVTGMPHTWERRRSKRKYFNPRRWIGRRLILSVTLDPTSRTYTFGIKCNMRKFARRKK